MDQTFGPFGSKLGNQIFLEVLPLLVVRHFLTQIRAPKIFFMDLWMLDIAASYHYMQFQGKLKNQTWKIEKNLVLGLIFANLAQIQAANFFLKIWLCQSLDAMVSYLHVQYQKKLQIQSLENLVTERQTNRQTHRGTGTQEWFHRMLSN